MNLNAGNSDLTGFSTARSLRQIGDQCSSNSDCPDNIICRHPLTGGRNDPPTSRNFDTSRSKVCAYKLDEGMPCTLDRDCKNNHCAFGRCAVTLTVDQERWPLGNICTILQKGEKFIREKGVIEKRVGPSGAAKKGTRTEVQWGSWVKTPLGDYQKIVIVHAADYVRRGSTGKFYIYKDGVRSFQTGELVSRGTSEATPGEAWWANSPSHLWDSTTGPGRYSQIRRQPPIGGNQAARNILLVHAADQQTRQIRSAYSFSSCRPCSNNPGHADYCFRELHE